MVATLPPSRDRISFAQRINQVWRDDAEWWPLRDRREFEIDA
jgi:hypothetical protein